MLNSLGKLVLFFLVLLFLVESCGSMTSSTNSSSNLAGNELIIPQSYPSAAAQSGASYTQAEANQKCADAWSYFKSELVTSDGAVIHTDTNSVVSEGQSYGMMLAVQNNDQETFDKIWSWTKTRLQDGNQYGLFAWKAGLDGSISSASPAPDADVMIALALFFASKLWTDKAAPYDYSAQAKDICKNILNYEVTSDNYLAFCIDNKSIFSASYQMPAFFRLFALYTGESRWNEVASNSYSLIINCLKSSYGNTSNGLVPDRSAKDGTRDNTYPTFGYDAVRTPYFVAIDEIWFDLDDRSQSYCDKIAGFFGPAYSSFGDGYALDGTRISNNHAASWVGALAGGVMGSSSLAHQTAFFNHLMGLSWPTGQYRYYDICWVNFGLLLTAGKFRIYN